MTNTQKYYEIEKGTKSFNSFSFLLDEQGFTLCIFKFKHNDPERGF